MKTVSIETLRGDLKCAWEWEVYTEEQRKNGEWIFAIDPESMNTLKDLQVNSDKSYSLSSLAWAVLNDHTIIPANVHPKVVSLSEALLKATMEALEASHCEDGGSCNFDSPVIRLPRWKDCEIKQAIALSGVTIGETLSGYWRGYRFVNTKMYGQANQRTRMAEAAKKSLEADGCDVAMYYQMD